MRRRVLAVVALMGVVLSVSTACDGPGVNGSDSSGANPSSPVATSLPADTVSSLTAAEICAVLTPRDMAPLTDGAVTEPPVPVNSPDGLPGCKWPVQDGWGWLDLSVFRPVSVEVLQSIAVWTYTVDGDAVGWSSDRNDGLHQCLSVVRSPRTPTGYTLRVMVNAPVSGAEANLCRKAIPQTGKVLRALGW